MREVPGSTRNMRGASALCHVTMSQHYVRVQIRTGREREIRKRAT